MRHFTFEIPALERLDFTPGQFLSFTGQLQGKNVTRAYSIASPPGGNRFELCLNRVKEGIFSPHLFSLEPGEEIACKGPYGVFTLRQEPAESLFVATGTGVAPFRSMLLAALPAGTERRFTLLAGSRYEEAILYREEFEAAAREHANFTYLPALTRPGASWSGRAGRVQTHLAELTGGRTDIDVYTCGLNEMVSDVRRMLKEMGFDRKRIIYERYD